MNMNESVTDSPKTFVTAVRARRSHCFTNINVLIVLGWRLARQREIVSWPPEKLSWNCRTIWQGNVSGRLNRKSACYLLISLANIVYSLTRHSLGKIQIFLV